MKKHDFSPITLKSAVDDLTVTFRPDSQSSLLIQNATVHSSWILKKVLLRFSGHKLSSFSLWT